VDAEAVPEDLLTRVDTLVEDLISRSQVAQPRGVLIGATTPRAALTPGHVPPPDRNPIAGPA
jgi:hypothetical protein